MPANFRWGREGQRLVIPPPHAIRNGVIDSLATWLTPLPSSI
jgi:hypothetical protein